MRKNYDDNPHEMMCSYHVQHPREFSKVTSATNHPYYRISQGTLIGGSAFTRFQYPRKPSVLSSLPKLIIPQYDHTPSTRHLKSTPDILIHLSPGNLLIFDWLPRWWQCNFKQCVYNITIWWLCL